MMAEEDNRKDRPPPTGLSSAVGSDEFAKRLEQIIENLIRKEFVLKSGRYDAEMIRDMVQEAYTRFCEYFDQGRLDNKTLYRAPSIVAYIKKVVKAVVNKADRIQAIQLDDSMAHQVLAPLNERDKERGQLLARSIRSAFNRMDSDKANILRKKADSTFSAIQAKNNRSTKKSLTLSAYKERHAAAKQCLLKLLLEDPEIPHVLKSRLMAIGGDPK